MARVQIDFIDSGHDGAAADLQSGSAAQDAGDLACWASLVCAGCGGVTTDPAHDLQHRRWLAALDRERPGE